MNRVRFPRRRGDRGFTLVELLVVVTIIAVLAGLLMPAFSKAMQQVKTTKCASNMGAWGKAYFLYLGDHDQVLPQQDKSTLAAVPTGSNWQEAIAPYLVGGTASSSTGLRFTMRSRYPCPNANSVNAGSSIYACTAYLDPFLNSRAPTTFMGVPNRPNFLLIADTISFWVIQDWNGSAGVQFTRHRSGKYTGKNGKANFFFADGHMETLTLDQAMARTIQVLPP